VEIAKVKRLKKDLAAAQRALKQAEVEKKVLRDQLQAERTTMREQLDATKLKSEKLAIELNATKAVTEKEKDVLTKKMKTLENNLNETMRIATSGSHSRKGSLFGLFDQGAPPAGGSGSPEPSSPRKSVHESTAGDSDDVRFVATISPYFTTLVTNRLYRPTGTIVGYPAEASAREVQGGLGIRSC
jgi:seryl-tRNA synthetase